MVTEEPTASEIQSKKAAKKLAAKAEKDAKVSESYDLSRRQGFTTDLKHFRKRLTKRPSKLQMRMPKMPVKTSLKANTVLRR